jgi:hypothetical protein
MEKDVRFEIVLVGPQLRGESSGIPEIYVQVVTGDKAPFYMRENNFMNRCVKLPRTTIIRDVHFLSGVSNSFKELSPKTTNHVEKASSVKLAIRPKLSRRDLLIPSKLFVLMRF